MHRISIAHAYITRCNCRTTDNFLYSITINVLNIPAGQFESLRSALVSEGLVVILPRALTQVPYRRKVHPSGEGPFTLSFRILFRDTPAHSSAPSHGCPNARNLLVAAGMYLNSPGDSTLYAYTCNNIKEILGSEEIHTWSQTKRQPLILRIRYRFINTMQLIERRAVYDSYTHYTYKLSHFANQKTICIIMQPFFFLNIRVKCNNQLKGQAWAPVVLVQSGSHTLQNTDIIAIGYLLRHRIRLDAGPNRSLRPTQPCHQHILPQTMRNYINEVLLFIVQIQSIICCHMTIYKFGCIPVIK